jgi:hypothetical protein
MNNDHHKEDRHRIPVDSFTGGELPGDRPVVFPMPPVVDRPVYLPDGSVDHRPHLPRTNAVVFAAGTEADPTPGVSCLHPCSCFEDRAGAHLSMWLRGRRDLLRDRQWLKPSAGGEIILMPAGFRAEREARVIA